MFRLLASYPKSGNTYVRIFLANYLRGETDLNKVGWPIFSSHAFFPIGMPRTYARVDSFKRECYAKTHEIGNLFYGSSFERAVYIVRNPLDIVPSFSRHMSCDLDTAIARLGNKNQHLQGTDKIYPQLISDWSSNVISWLQNKRFPVFFIRYETLCAYPTTGFKSLLAFLNVPIIEDKFLKALEFSSFDSLKKTEAEMLAKGEKEKFREARGSTGKFFNVGKPGNGKEVMTVQQIERVYKRHKHLMDLLHYAPK